MGNNVKFQPSKRIRNEWKSKELNSKEEERKRDIRFELISISQDKVEEDSGNEVITSAVL